MIAQLIHIGPASNCQDMKGDANEALLIIGATLFWAAVSPSHLSFSPSPRCGSEGSPRGGGDWSDEPKGGVRDSVPSDLLRHPLSRC